MQCHATAQNGKRCGGPALRGSQYCFTHDPAKAAARVAARRLGGLNRSRGNPIPFPECNVRTVGGLSVLMEQAIHETWKIENSLTRGRTLAYLVQVQRGVLEVSDLEVRVKRLEDFVAAQSQVQR